MTEAKEVEISSIDDIMKIANEEYGHETPSTFVANDEAQSNEQVVDEDANSQGDKEIIPENLEHSNGDANGDGVVEEFAPDYSYSVKGEEKTFDERIHHVIKSKEDEEYFRQLYTKADGLDDFKSRLAAEEAAKKELADATAELKDQIEVSSGFYQDLVSKRDSNDWRSVQKAIGYDDEAILKMAVEIAKERQLPEDQRSIVENNRILAEQNQMLQANQQYHSQMNSINATNNLIQTQTRELEDGISQQYSELAEAMKGKGFDIMQEAVNVGRTMVDPNTGVEPAVKDVLEAVNNKYGFIVENTEPIAPDITNKVQVKESVPTIRGNTGSAVKSEYTSIDDLQRLVDQYNRNTY